MLTPININKKATKIIAVAHLKTSAKYDAARFMVRLGGTTKVVTDKENRPAKINRGRWTLQERLAFLRGLRVHGKSKWKEISKMIPTRDTTQVKTHAQSLMKLQAGGRDIFHELDYQEQHDRRFVTEEEELNVAVNDDQPDLGALTTPTFVWKTEDFDTARTLIALREGKKIGVPY